MDPPYMSFLPIEIWHECFSLLDQDDRISLNGTCKLFHAIAFPLVFRKLSLTCDMSSRPQETNAQYFIRMERLGKKIGDVFPSFLADPIAPRLVREIFIVYRPNRRRISPAIQGAIDKVDSLFIDLFKNFDKLVNLRLVRCEFKGFPNGRIIDFLASLPSLEEVKFSNTIFDGLLQPKVLFWRGRRFFIEDSFDAPDRQDTDPMPLDILAAYKLEEISLKSLTYAPEILTSLTALGNCQRLRRLTFTMASLDLPLLYKFLATCPNLEFLDWRIIDDDLENTVSMTSVPPSSISELKHFTGPITAVAAVTRGRPVSELCIRPSGTPFFFDLDNLEGVLNNISRGITVAVRHLSLVSLNMTVSAFDFITQTFPDIILFEMFWKGENLFPGENPHDSIDYRPCRCPWNNEEVRSVRLHKRYLHILHFAIMGKIELPRNLEHLRLKFHGDGEIICTTRGKRTAEDLIRNGFAYTTAMGTSLLSAFSEKYPRFRKLTIDTRVRNIQKKDEWWEKNPSTGRWWYVGNPKLTYN
ncbi:hypothetical protein CPC08DRAFT_138911 [Agrocybe pediades]|nr:hypothetical protein CPC08DRAFT_138911 [Agrocybe pediades]